MERLYTPKEVAEILTIHPITVFKWLRNGKLQGVRVGSLWRIPERVLDDVAKNGTYPARKGDE